MQRSAIAAPQRQHMVALTAQFVAQMEPMVWSAMALHAAGVKMMAHATA